MLRARVLTAIAGVPLLLWCLYLGGPAYSMVVAAIAAAGLWEGLRLLGLERTRGALVFGLLGAGAWLAGPIAGKPHWTWPALTAFAAALLVRQVLRFPAGITDEAARVWFAATYAGLPFAHFLLLRQMPGGFALTLVAFLMTWAFDTAAYFGGVRWGKHRLAPAISPGKTWEGAAAGSIATIALAAVPAAAWPLSLAGRACAAALVIVFGQLGDLAESTIKRHAGAKDSGRLLPGHGGVLDRFDSLMFTVPAIYYLAQLAPAVTAR